MPDESNPCAPPSCEPVSVPPPSFVARWHLFSAGMFAWVGMTIGGGLCGFIWHHMDFFLAVIALCLAAIVGLPVTVVVVLLFALISPLQIRKRTVIFVGATCGALTGFLCSVWFFGVSPAGIVICIFDAGVCAVGAAAFVFQYLLRPSINGRG